MLIGWLACSDSKLSQDTRRQDRTSEAILLDDLQVVIDAKAAVAQSRRDAYELKRREREQEATRIRCDAFEAAAESFLTVNSNEAVNVTNVHESQAAVRNLQLPSVSQPGYYNHSSFFLLSSIKAYDLLCRSGHAPILDQVLLNNYDEGTVLHIFISFVNMQ